MHTFSDTREIPNCILHHLDPNSNPTRAIPIAIIVIPFTMPFRGVNQGWLLTWLAPAHLWSEPSGMLPFTSLNVESL